MSIEEIIRKLADKGDVVYSKVCTVIAVDRTKRLIDARPVDGTADVLDVRLQAAAGYAKGVVIYPVVGSDVVVTFLNKDAAYVALTTQVDKVSVANESVDVASLIGDLLDLLDNFQLATNQGPTVQVMPHVKLKIQALRQQVAQIIE